MQRPPLDPDVADTAPSNSVLTRYDEEHVITYLRLLDADAQGADWRGRKARAFYLSAAMNVAGVSNSRASSGGAMSNIFTSLRKAKHASDAVDVALLAAMSHSRLLIQNGVRSFPQVVLISSSRSWPSVSKDCTSLEMKGDHSHPLALTTASGRTSWSPATTASVSLPRRSPRRGFLREAAARSRLWPYARSRTRTVSRRTDPSNCGMVLMSSRRAESEQSFHASRINQRHRRLL
jgi:hypothetical protein